MSVGAVATILDRPVDYLLPFAGHLGFDRRALPIEALLAAPAGLLLNILVVAVRRFQSPQWAASHQRRDEFFMVVVAILFGALEAAEIGLIYGLIG
jgi:hypothetical protein